MAKRSLIHADLAADFRRQMPVTQKWTYLDHAAVAPLSSPAQAALQRWLHQAVEEGDTVWTEWSREVESVRRTASGLIGAEPSEVALVANTSTGVSLVAEGFPWQAGDNVVSLTGEFPANVYPWMNLASRGVELRRVPLKEGIVDLNQLDEACDERTRIVAASWVGYSSGFRTNLASLADLAHRHGAKLFVDAIQGLGVFPIDVRDSAIDFLAADGHKWMLGPEGAGVLFVRRDHLELLRPLGIGWNSVVHSHDYSRIEFRLKDTAARYEGGSHNMAGVLALGASLEMLDRLQIKRIAERVLAITDLACERLETIGARIVSCRDGDHRSGIVAFVFEGPRARLSRENCLARGVALSRRGGRLRISPHAYNDSNDLDRLIEVLGDAPTH